MLAGTLATCLTNYAISFVLNSLDVFTYSRKSKIWLVSAIFWRFPSKASTHCSSWWCICFANKQQAAGDVRLCWRDITCKDNTHSIRFNACQVTSDWIKLDSACLCYLFNILKSPWPVRALWWWVNAHFTLTDKKLYQPRKYGCKSGLNCQWNARVQRLTAWRNYIYVNLQ
jgi:hypothetical protein